MNLNSKDFKTKISDNEKLRIKIDKVEERKQIPKEVDSIFVTSETLQRVQSMKLLTKNF
jgi:hypothetical protein